MRGREIQQVEKASLEGAGLEQNFTKRLRGLGWPRTMRKGRGGPEQRGLGS